MLAKLVRETVQCASERAERVMAGGVSAPTSRRREVALTVDDSDYRIQVEPRVLLVDASGPSHRAESRFVRHDEIGSVGTALVDQLRSAEPSGLRRAKSFLPEIESVPVAERPSYGLGELASWREANG